MRRAPRAESGLHRARARAHLEELVGDVEVVCDVQRVERLFGAEGPADPVVLYEGECMAGRDWKEGCLHGYACCDGLNDAVEAAMRDEPACSLLKRSRDSIRMSPVIKYMSTHRVSQYRLLRRPGRQ